MGKNEIYQFLVHKLLGPIPPSPPSSTSLPPPPPPELRRLHSPCGSIQTSGSKGTLLLPSNSPLALQFINKMLDFLDDPFVTRMRSATVESVQQLDTSGFSTEWFNVTLSINQPRLVVAEGCYSSSRVILDLGTIEFGNELLTLSGEWWEQFKLDVWLFAAHSIPRSFIPFLSATSVLRFYSLGRGHLVVQDRGGGG